MKLLNSNNFQYMEEAIHRIISSYHSAIDIHYFIKKYLDGLKKNNLITNYKELLMLTNPVRTEVSFVCEKNNKEYIIWVSGD